MKYLDCHLDKAYDKNPTNVVMTPWTIVISILKAGNEKPARVAAMKWVFILFLLLSEPTQSYIFAWIQIFYQKPIQIFTNPITFTLQSIGAGRNEKNT